MTTLNPGQGFFVSNPSGTASPRMAGPVGNIGTNANALAVGYNIIGISEGKNLAASSAFESASPVSSYDEEQADQVVMMNANGSWRRLIRINGSWYDTATKSSTSLTLTPGQAYYYIRRSTETSVDF